MFIVKRINNNAVLCLDSNGRQVVAIGRGLASAERSTELDLDLVEHTFYDVEPRYIDLLRDLPADILELSASIVDWAKMLLSYELSPNIEVALADHITFAIQRMHEGIVLSAPLTYDLQQLYPVEFKIAQYALKRIAETAGVKLPKTEAAGVAMCIINGAVASGSTAAAAEKRPREDELLEQITAIVEHEMGVTVDREGFGFARFATHVQYLLERIASQGVFPTENASAYAALASEHPQASACADVISLLIRSVYKQDLTEEEKLYLILHINRICARSGS